MRGIETLRGVVAATGAGLVLAGCPAVQEAIEEDDGPGGDRKITSEDIDSGGRDRGDEDRGGDRKITSEDIDSGGSEREDEELTPAQKSNRRSHLRQCKGVADAAVERAQKLHENPDVDDYDVKRAEDKIDSLREQCAVGAEAEPIRGMEGHGEIVDKYERATQVLEEYKGHMASLGEDEARVGPGVDQMEEITPARRAPPPEGAPEALACKGPHRYDSSDVDHQFHILYCEEDQKAHDVEQNAGRVAEGVVWRAITTLQDTIETQGVHAKERWRASYVHLCSTLLQDQSSPGPYTTLTCKWYADQLELGQLVEQESWMSGAMREHMREQLEYDRDVISEVAAREYPSGDADRQREVYYELRNQVWQQYVRDRRGNRKYYRAVDSFKSDVLSGEIEGCVDTLRGALGDYISSGGRMRRGAVVDHVSTPVGYALTEALARCHWHHERDFVAGVYLRFLQDERRRVSFGERLYFEQLEELRQDAKKGERMPHLVGDEILEMEPRDLETPSLLVLSEVEREWQREVTGLANAIEFHEDTVRRVRDRGNRVVFQFPSQRVQVPIRDCEKTDRIDRIRRDGKVVYERECEVTGHRTATKQTPALKVSKNRGISRGDWVKFAYDTSDHDRQMVYIAAKGDDDRAPLRQVLNFPAE